MMMSAMDIELVVVPDCPHQSAAEDLLRTALADVGLPTGFQVVIITDPVVGKSIGLSCRIYRSKSGLSGLPDLQALRQALKRHADLNV